MNEIEIIGTDDALEYFEEVVCELLLLFPITKDEAVGRVNRFWRCQDFSKKLKVDLLKHEDPTFWAKTIYYGRDVQWWKDENDLEPDPYP
jgi:hypothetical protein